VTIKATAAAVIATVAVQVSVRLRRPLTLSFQAGPDDPGGEGYERERTEERGQSGRGVLGQGYVRLAVRVQHARRCEDDEVHHQLREAHADQDVGPGRPQLLQLHAAPRGLGLRRSAGTAASSPALPSSP
jgi:hypothetical protein